MTVSEFQLFAVALKTYFPKDNLFPNKQAVDMWYSMLNDIDYKIAELFLKKWVSENKWSPSIADIRAGSVNISDGEIEDWGNGWEQVEKAIRYYGMYREDEALNSMDDLTRSVVRRLGFKNMCTSENLQVDRANFRMLYEQLAEKKKNTRTLQPNLYDLIQQARNIKSIEERNEFTRKYLAGC